ncbi:general secretion pathway protein GspK [Desulfococcaceae bacterium HSG7]|nr:general secretion pathway protein GspK [Desulfococcaceae bacterium HSG7]
MKFKTLKCANIKHRKNLLPAAGSIKNNRGMALLLTLTIITLLVVVTLEFNRKVRTAVFATATSRDRLTLTYKASSGINLAMAVLLKDKKDSKIDSIQEDWANPDKLKEIAADIPFEDGKLEIKISDERARIQVNALIKYPQGSAPNDAQMFLWDRLLTNLAKQIEEADTEKDSEEDEVEPRAIVNSLKDWLDFGDDDAITGLNGAESDYYKGLEPPYECKNGPITHISELMQVKGITAALYKDGEDAPGLADFVTIYGAQARGGGRFSFDGKININTAELPVLMALLPADQDVEALAQAMYDYRAEMSEENYVNDLKSPTWYKKADGLNNITIDPKLITTTSDLFRIEAVAAQHDVVKKVVAVLERVKDKKSGKYNCRILSWEPF